MANQIDRPPPPALTRRAVLAGSLGGLAFPAARAATPGDDAEWRAFKSQYLTDDGRVVDIANGGISHSEGQGWGMLFATAFDDREGFDRIYGWTERMLQRPADTLHAWRFTPTAHPPVADLNNAADGDIFIAAALARAGRQWSRPKHARAASDIAHDIAAKLIHPVGTRLVLLPGVQGFESADAVTVNPWYYAFPFLAELGRLTPSLPWDRLQRDGRRLIEQARFGQWNLPPDWLRVPRDGSAPSPAPAWPPRFGYDAIRVPLWSTWQNLPVGAVRGSLEQFWSGFPDYKFPAWVDLVSNETAPYVATSGLQAVARLTHAAVSGGPPPALPQVADAGSYLRRRTGAAVPGGLAESASSLNAKSQPHAHWLS